MRVCAGSIYLTEIYFTGVLLIDKIVPCEEKMTGNRKWRCLSHPTTKPMFFCAFFLFDNCMCFTCLEINQNPLN